MSHRRRRAIVAFFALALLGASTFGPIQAASAASTIAAATLCANGEDNTPGLGLICETTVVNTLTASGGSAHVTIRECHGAAGDPGAACTTTEQDVPEPVTSVTQCNDTTNGGGGTLRCSVEILTIFLTDPSASTVTVNQCVGSGDGIANTCDPFPATTTGATITQCNGSANGGTLVELRCTATGTESAGLVVTVNQCNDATNGGGALVVCSANVSTEVAALPTATPTASPTTGGSSGVTPPPTDTTPVRPSPAPLNRSTSVALLVLFGAALAASFTVTRRRVAVRQPRD